MNALYSPSNPLPTILDQPFGGPTRRRCINGFQLAAAELDRFNRLLARLGRPRELDADQIASAGRELCRPASPLASPPCIRQRLRWIAAVGHMLADRHWEPANEAADAASAMVDYARSRDDLIPDWLPKVGRLDDVIVAEAAWPKLSVEVDEYLDYCRLRSQEARQRGHSPDAYAFTRADYEQVRYEEAVLARYERQVRESSFLPASVPMFHVH